MKLGDFLSAINDTKQPLLDDSSVEKFYSPYVINRCLSPHLDCILFVNEMNIRGGVGYNLSKIAHFEFLKNTLRKQKRYAKLPKLDEEQSIKNIMKVNNCSMEKAKEICSILTIEQINKIESMLEEGG